MNEWINVKEKLPERDERVLISTFNIVTIAWRDSDITQELKWVILDPINHKVTPNCRNYDYHITHWMKLPQPPNMR